jgi:hypothetical protein
VPREYSKHYFTGIDLQKLTGLRANSVNQQRSRGEFDPDNFESVFYWVCANGTREVQDGIWTAIRDGRKYVKRRTPPKKRSRRQG